MPPKVNTPPSGSSTAASPAIDPNVLAAAVAAALAQIQTTTPAPARSLPSIPKFVYDCGKPNCASRWFQQLDSLFRLQTVTDADKCALAANALDSSTFDKVARALLPDPIETLVDYTKLRDTMVGLFDYSVSLFASRYAALNLEWKGPEYESIAEYGSRIENAAAAFKDVTAEELKTLMLMMGMKHPALESYRLQVLNKLNQKPNTPLAECLRLMNAALQTQREQRLPVQGSVNYVQRKEHKPSASKKHSHRSASATSSSSRASSNASSSSRPGFCDSCGGKHRRSTCKYRDAECFGCGGIGHIKKVCKKNSSSKSNIPASKHVKNVRISDPPAPRVNTVRINDSASWRDGCNSDTAPPSKSVDAPQFRRGDYVNWYNSDNGSIHPGYVVGTTGGMVEIQHGEHKKHRVLVEQEDVISAAQYSCSTPSTASTTRKNKK